MGVCAETYDLDRSDASHQLLQQSNVTVRELADALPNELLLIHREAVTVATFQQTARADKEKKPFQLSVFPMKSHK